MIRRLLLTYIILIVLPLTVTSIFSYIVFKKNMEYQVAQSIERTVDLLQKQVHQHFDSLVQLSATVMNNDKVIGANRSIIDIIREGERSQGEDSQFNAYLRAQSINLFLNNNFLNRFRELNRVFIYLQTGELFNVKRTTTSVDQEALSDMQQELISSNQQWIIRKQNRLGDGEASIYLLRRINEPMTHKYLGTIILDINLKELSQDLQNALLPDQQLVLLWQKSLPILDSAKQWTPNEFIIQAADRVTLHNISHASDRLLISYSSPQDSQWTVITYLQYKALGRGMDTIRNWLIIISFLCVLVAIVIAFIMARGILSPLQSLRNALKRMGNGIINTKVAIQGKDEVADLAIAFNSMTERLSQSIDEVYRAQLAYKDAELRALHTQINPHFLYNTLESVRMVAEMQGAPDAGEMARALGALFRATTDYKAIISLKQELHLLHQYQRLQEMRFDGVLQMEYDIQVDTDVVLIPKLALQTLVENCIKYAFPHASEDSPASLIRVKAYAFPEVIKIEVSDNGVGMKEELVQAMNQAFQIEYKESSQVGLANINNRIRLKWGKVYGIYIASEIGKGTKVSLSLPPNPPEEA